MSRYYGGLVWTVAATTTLSANTPAQAAGTVRGTECFGFSVDKTNNALVCEVDEPAVYFVAVAASIEKGAGGVSDTINHIYKNDLTTGHRVERYIANSGQEGAYAIMGLVTLKKGDTIKLYLETDTGDDLDIQPGSSISVFEAS